MLKLEPDAQNSSSPSLPLPKMGVYIHFPWCERKCPYCDFASFVPELDIDHEGYADLLIREIQYRADALDKHNLATVFVGGGTPSLWQPAALGRVLAELDRRWSLGPEVEITVECNPRSLNDEKAKALHAIGVNRLSIGVQSFDNERLAFLGRLHSGSQALTALSSAVSAGFEHVSADLMYGVALDDAPESWQKPMEAAAEARQVAELGLTHISAYSLTIEPNTEFGARKRAGTLPQIGDSWMAETFAAVGQILSGYGIQRYEVSNYANPGEESRHNLGYWRGEDYLGLGCAAFGTLSEPDGSALRYRNSPTPSKYLKKAKQGQFDAHEIERLAPEVRLRERLMLGLRLREGVDLDRARRELGVEPWTTERAQTAARLQEKGRLRRHGDLVSIPADAWLFADGTAAALF